MITLELTQEQYDAALAGARLLARALKAGDLEPNDGDIGDILTNSGAHAGLSAQAIHAMADAWQSA